MNVMAGRRGGDGSSTGASSAAVGAASPVGGVSAVVGASTVAGPPRPRRHLSGPRPPGRVLELPDRLRGTPHRPAAGPAVGGDQPQQEDDRLAGDQQQEDHDEEQRRAHGRRPVPRHGQRRQDDEHDQHDHLEPEAAEARAPRGLEVRALVLDRAGRARTARRRGSGRVERRRSGVDGSLLIAGRPTAADPRRLPGDPVSSVTVPRPAAAARSPAPRRPRRRAARAGSPASR